MDMVKKNKLGALVKGLREKRGLSQAEAAEKLGVSRSSYIAIEQGKRELTISEAQKLSDILGVDFFELADERQIKREKYKQMILFFLRLFGKDKKTGVPKTKLAKLLYLADFAHFYENLQSMSGLKYRKIDHGPVPDDYFYLLEEMTDSGELEIKELSGGAHMIKEGRFASRVSDNLLSFEEKKTIKKIYKKWRDAKTQEIVDFTHKQIPYRFANYKEIVPYELILQEDHGNIF